MKTFLKILAGIALLHIFSLWIMLIGMAFSREFTFTFIEYYEVVGLFGAVSLLCFLVIFLIRFITDEY